MKTGLLITLFICHWMADYTHLSTTWMLNAKRFGKPLLPIFFHALIHSILMCFCLEIYFYNILDNYNPFEKSLTLIYKLFIFQLMTHFIIDVLKGRVNVWIPTAANPGNKLHWYIFGFDQLLHAIVIILMIHYIN